MAPPPDEQPSEESPEETAEPEAPTPPEEDAPRGFAARFARASGMSLTWVLVFAAALIASVAFHVHTPVARQATKEAVNEYVSMLLAGRLEIGAIEELSPWHAVALDTTVYDPEGRAVIRGARVRLGFDWPAMADGLLHFPTAHLQGGELILYEDADGSPSFLRAFASPDPDEEPSEPGGLSALVDEMKLEGVTVHGDLLGLEGLRVEDARAHAQLRYDGDAEHGFEMRFFDARGRLVAPFPFEARIQRVVGHTTDDPAEGARFWARVARGEEAAAANLVYALPEGASEDELDLRLHVDPVRAETLEEAGFEWAEVLQGEARGHLRLHGPPDALRLDGRLETAGGRVRLEGALPVEGATRIRVDTEGEAGLRLDRVLDGAPPVAVRGRFELEAEGEADPRVRVDLEPFTFGELEVPAVEAEGVLGEEGVTVERARARIAGDDVILRGTVGYDGSAELDVEGDVRQLQDDPTVARLAPELRGGVGFRMRVEAGAEGELALRGRWVFRNLRYPPLEVRRLVAIGTVGGDLASPALGLDLGFEGVRVGGAPLGDGDGRIDGDAGAYRARLALATPQRRIVIEGAELRVGDALRVDAEAVELRAAGQTWTGRVDGLVARGSDLEVQTLALRDGEQRITLSGRWRRGRGRDDALRAEAWNVQIGDVLALLEVPELDLDGRVDGTAELTGDLEGQPAIDIDATIADLRLAENMGFQSSVLARYRAGQLEVDWGLTHASGTAVDLDLEGTLDTGSPFLDALSTAAYAGTLQVRHLDLARIRTVTDAVPPLEGHAGGLLTFSGGIDAFDFDLRAEVPRLRVGDLPVIGLAANVGYQEGALILRALTRDDGGELVEAEAAALLDLLGVLEDPSLLPMLLDVAPWRLALRFPPRDLGTLPEPLRALLPLSEGLRGSATLSLRGGAYRPHADLLAHVEYGAFYDEPPVCGDGARPRAWLRAQLANGETRGEVAGFLGDRRVLHATGRAQTPLADWMRDPERFRLPAASVDAFVTNAELAEIPEACRYAEGPLTVAAHLQGLFTDQPSASIQLYGDSIAARRLELRGRGERRRVAVRERTPPSAVRIKSEVANGVATLDGTIDWFNGGTTRLAGDLPVRWGGEAGPLPTVADDAELFATADLLDMPVATTLAWLAEVGQAGGGLYGHVIAQGPWRAPSFSGEVELVEGRFQLPTLGQRLEDVEGRFLFEDDRIVLQSFAARDGEGIAQLAGDLTLRGLAPDRAELRVAAQRFPVRQEGSVLAGLDGTARIEASFLDNGLRGRVQVEEMAVAVAEDAGRSPQELAPHPDVIVLGEEPGEPLGEPYMVDFRIGVDEPIEVKAQDFDADLEADLHVSWGEELRIGGAVELLSGYFDVFGKRFDVERGALTFNEESTDLDPQVNLVAVHELRSRSGETVTVTASGRLSNPVIRFSSTLTNDRAEIIALLVSGDVRRETDIEAERAPTDFLAGIAAGVLTLSLREEFGAIIPSIGIESNARGGTRVRGGWRLGDLLPDSIRRIIQGFYIEGFFNTGGEEAQRTFGGQVQDYGFLLELAFPRNVVNTNTFAPPNNFSFDVTWQP